MELNNELKKQLLGKVTGKSAYIVCQIKFKSDITIESSEVLTGDYEVEGDEQIMTFALLYAMQRDVNFMLAVLAAARVMLDPVARIMAENVMK